MPRGKPALFLDRDGVLIRDHDLLISTKDVELLPGVAAAVGQAQRADFTIVVITNQSVVARGLCSEAEVAAVHARIDEELEAGGAAKLDSYKFCPHHPDADVLAYRTDCDCRKPKPGMLLSAAEDLRIDFSQSFAIGDRMSDVLAGHRAGCRTILVESGMHTAPLIVGVRADQLVEPTYRVASLPQAISRILE